MNLLEVPYLRKYLDGTALWSELCENLIRLADNNYEASVSLVRKLIAQRELAEGESHATLTNLLDHIYAWFEDNTEYAQHRVMIDVLVKRRLAHMNASALNRVMRYIDCANDENEAREWLEDHYSIAFCDSCDEWEFDNHMSTTREDDYRCRNCIDRYYVWSEHYEQHINADCANSCILANGDQDYCDSDDDDFEYDDERGCYVHVDFVPRDPPIIGNYHSSKSRHVPVIDMWSSENHRWFGLELEVEVKDVPREDKARYLNDRINDGDIGKRVFFENDGSLTNGFEIITQPMSLPAQRDLWQWLTEPKAVANLRSHNTTTCGLHVHINRDGLSQIQVARMVTFINDPGNEQLVRAIARRYAEGYCRIKSKTLDNALDSTDRYEAINITGHRTVEFRIFRGSLKYESVIAAVEFAHALSSFSHVFTKAEQLTTDNFLSFVETDMSKDTVMLRSYLNNRMEANASA